jgi:hypothetical protein
VALLCAFSLTTGCKKVASIFKPKPAPVFNRPRVDAALQRMLAKIQDDPKFKEAVAKGPAPKDKGEKLDLAVTNDGGYRELGAQLTAKGTARLSPGQFLELSNLKLALAEKSPKLCAGFWSGGISSDELGAGLDQLSDAQIERWFELSEQAVHLELYATTPLPRFRGQVVVEGIRDVAATLPEAEATAFTDTMQQGTAAPPAAACQAYLRLVKGGLSFTDPRRDTFLRALSFDTLVDW